MSKEDEYKEIPDAEGFSINAEGAVIDSDGEAVSHIMVGKTKKFRLNVEGTIRTFKADELVADLFGESSEEEEETPAEEVPEDEAAEEAAAADAAEEETAEETAEEETKEEEAEEPEKLTATQKALAKRDAKEAEAKAAKEEKGEKKEDAPAKSTEKKTTTKKTTAKKAEKKPKGPGVILSIFNAIEGASGDGVTEADILKALAKLFPKKEESSMKNTIRAQIGTKKSPCRMEKERDVTFKITTKKEVRYFKIK